MYQAFKPEIGQYAVAHQRFTGCPDYNSTRMTWIKTNFLWMMFRCGCSPIQSVCGHLPVMGRLGADQLTIK